MKYYRIKKEHGLRAGLNSTLRTEVGDDLLLSEKDVRMITLTIEERLSALNGVEYNEEPIKTEIDLEDESNEELDEEEVEPEIEE